MASERVYRRICAVWRLAVAVAAAVSVLASSAAAAPLEVADHEWEGLSDFAELARGQLGPALSVTQHLDLGALRAEDGLIVVHPERSLDVDSLASFLSAGGRVVLLDDFGTGDKLLRRFDIERVPLPARPVESLRHNPQLAIAEPVGQSELVRDVGRVVTNHAMGLTNPRLTPLLVVPDARGGSVTLALVGQAARGKLAVVGDSSIVMNLMLRYPGNAQLARNLIAFAGRPGGKVYLAAGAFEQRGTFAGDGPSVATHEIAAPLSTALAGLGPRLTQVAAALVGLGVVVWVGSRAGRTYKPARPRLTRLIPLFTQGGAAGHAAAVGGRGASRDLALIEIGKALEEELALTLGLPRVPAHGELVGRLLAAGLLDRASAAPLERLLSDVTQVDTLISAGRGSAVRRVTDDEVLAAADIAASVRREVRSRAPSGRAA